MVALAIKGGRPIAFGVNSPRFSKEASFCNMSVHAEVDLIKRLGDRAGGSKICVYRFNIGDHAESRAARTSLPCPTCQYSLRKAGVARVTAIDIDGSLRTMKHEELLKFETDPYFLARYLYMYNPTLRSQLLTHASMP